jgi:phosphoglycolate phosphatase-like HAD superfamily hydrolase
MGAPRKKLVPNYEVEETLRQLKQAKTFLLGAVCTRSYSETAVLFVEAQILAPKEVAVGNRLNQWAT